MEVNPGNFFFFVLNENSVYLALTQRTQAVSQALNLVERVFKSSSSTDKPYLSQCCCVIRRGLYLVFFRAYYELGPSTLVRAEIKVPPKVPRSQSVSHSVSHSFTKSVSRQSVSQLTKPSSILNSTLLHSSSTVFGSTTTKSTVVGIRLGRNWTENFFLSWWSKY